VDFVRKWQEKTEIAVLLLLGWLGLQAGKYYNWSTRYGKANEHNASVPRDHWLEEWEKQAIIDFYTKHPLEGYRRLTFMLLDADVVACSPSSTYRVLKGAGLLDRWKRGPTKKGLGFEQPIKAHEHWHIDITHLNLGGTFYFLCSVLDGYSRMIVHWELAAAMREPAVELIIQRALEKHPGARPRIISDNGPQFIARDFKEFVRLTGLTHVRTSPYYPQSNGKKERFYGSLKQESFRIAQPQTQAEALATVDKYVKHYNEVRLHSAIGFIAPKDKLEGREMEIWRLRDERLAAARERRAKARAAQTALAGLN
jgi:transposase InsO family protein